MRDIARIEHPLIRSGKSQAQRHLDALQPDYVQVDERNLADFLVFIGDFAKQVCYYSPDNQEDGDWQSFFIFHEPVHIARISKHNPEKELTSFLAAIEAARNDQLHQKEALASLFGDGLNLAQLINSWVNGFKGGVPHELKNIILNLISTNFIGIMTQWVAVTKAVSIRLGLTFEADYSFAWTQPWGGKLGRSTILSARPDTTIMAIRGAEKRIVWAVLDRVEDLYFSLFKGVQEIIKQAPAYLEKGLLNTGQHAPHLSLVLAFFRLFQQLQGDLNTMTRRHLDFFYKDTLLLKESPAIPDSAYLILEIAKHLPEYKFNPGLLFKGGKDKNKQEILFQLPEELVASRAKISKLHTLFIDYQEFIPQGSNEKTGLIQGLYHTPKADSADGVEAPLDTLTPPSWHTLGSHYSRLESPDSHAVSRQYLAYPPPRLSLAIATKDLWLQAGKRDIVLTISCEIPISYRQQIISLIDETAIKTLINDSQIFEVCLTTEKGWMKVVSEQTVPNIDLNLGTYDLKIVLRLLEDFPPIVAATSKVLGEDIGADLPMLKVDYLHPTDSISNQNGPSLSFYHLLKNSIIQDLTLQVKASNITAFEVKTAAGLADPAGPFLPFGSNPKVKSQFSFAYQEMLEKQWKTFSLGFSWENNPTEIPDIYEYYATGSVAIDSFKVKVHSLGSFEDIGSLADRNLFDKIENIVNHNANFPLAKPINISLTAGDFRGDDFSRVMANQALAVSNLPDAKLTAIPHAIYKHNGVKTLGSAIKADDFKTKRSEFFTDLPKPPYLPVIQGLTLTYQTAPDHQPADLQLIHLGPFGGHQRHETSAASLADLSLSVLPCFSDEGSLYIGLEDLEAGSSLNLLFQLAESTANPELEKAEIEWSYLKDNEWHVLKPDFHVLSDGTFGLIQSGMVKLAIPRDITRNNSLMPAGLSWLKVAAPERSAAIAQTLAIHPHAVVASFVPNAQLYVGIKGIPPGTEIDVNVVMGTPKAGPAAFVNWNFLQQDQWISILPDQLVLADTTEGFNRTGSIRLRLPTEATLNNTRLPKDTLWLKAEIEGRGGVQTLALEPANLNISLNLTAQPYDTERLSTPLASGMVEKPTTEIGGLKKAVQPYDSFGGKPQESGDAFYLRVSEHLKHKGRAVNAFDYERILLQQFPEIHKVKCITHTLGRKKALRDSEDPQERDFHLAPGYVTLAVIPDLSKLTHDGRRNPRFTPGKLETFRQFLLQKTSPFVRLQVLNPLYESIFVAFDVAFRSRKSESFYKSQLHEDLHKFLAPWAFDEGEDISFGGVVHKSSILNYVEKLPYVDVIADFRMGDRYRVIQNEIKASESRSILTSGVHEVRPVDKSKICKEENTQHPDMKGVGYWRLGNNFE